MQADDAKNSCCELREFIVVCYRYFNESLLSITDDWQEAVNRQLRPSAGDVGLEYELGDAMDEIDSISVRVGFVGDLLQEVRLYNQIEVTSYHMPWEK